MPGPRHRRRGRGHHTARLLEPALLLLLQRGPAHGYTLHERLGEFRIGGLNPNVVYRALRDMEARGWITSGWDVEQTQGPPRRVYKLIENGRVMLRGWMQDLGDTRDQIDHLRDTYDRQTEDKGST